MDSRTKAVPKTRLKVETKNSPIKRFKKKPKIKPLTHRRTGSKISKNMLSITLLKK